MAEKKNKVIGYTEACRWNVERLDTFDQIREFPRLCDREGKNLYVVFLAVAPKMRQRGVGSMLMRALVRISEEKRVSKVHLVSKPELVRFYRGFGFSPVKDLPEFLPDSPGVLMELRVPGPAAGDPRSVASTNSWPVVRRSERGRR